MQMLSHRALSLIAVLACASCTWATPSTEQSAPVALEEGAYAGLLLHIYRGTPPDTVVAIDSTLVFRVPTGGRPEWRREFDDIPAPLTKSLADTSARRFPIGRLPLSRRVRALTAEEQRTIFGDGVNTGWERFHSQFPGAGQYIGLTPVVFNAGRTQALVYYEYHCGGLCGGGTLALLTREAGVWRVRKTVMFWVS